MPKGKDLAGRFQKMRLFVGKFILEFQKMKLLVGRFILGMYIYF